MNLILQSQLGQNTKILLKRTFGCKNRMLVEETDEFENIPINENEEEKKNNFIFIFLL